MTELDKTPTGIEEHDAFANPSNDRQVLENHSLSQDIEQRRLFADRAFNITVGWVLFLVVITFCQFFKHFDYGLSETQFNVVFTTTTASILVFWYLVGKYLFNPKN